MVVVAAVAIGLPACGGDEAGEAEPPPPSPAQTGEDTVTEPADTLPAEQPPEEPPPAETVASGECPFEGGTIRAFRAFDLAPVSGPEIGPAAQRAQEVWIEKVNSDGGISGCQIVVDVEDEAFPDVDRCLRIYRDAITSGQYDFFIGPQGSGCMAALPDLTNEAGVALIAGIAADHQPFFEKFGPYVFHPSVSTFLEGRASARLAAELGWKRVAMVVPNFAYGQDAGKAFKEYFLQLVPDGEIVGEQFPEFDEDNFTPFINAMVAKEPDGIFSAFFGGFVIPFWNQWIASGNDVSIPIISGAVVVDTFKLTKQESDIPQNAYGYTRGDWQLMTQTAIGQELFDLYVDRYGDEFPLPSEFGFQSINAIQMAKALIEETQSLDPDDWKAAVEAGDFSFESTYNQGPTYVNPINHMADTCAAAGQIVWTEDIPYHAAYDADSFVISCMRDILPAEEARRLTSNPDVSDEAISAYYELVGG